VFDSAGCSPYFFGSQGQNQGRVIVGVVPSNDGGLYIYGGYHGYTDGTTNDPTQRFVSRLYGLNVGVAEREQLHVEVFPNPSAGEIIVEVERSDGLEALEVRDALGRSVLQQRITGTRMVLDLSHQADGLYTVTLRSKAHAPVVRRVVIQR